MTNSVNEILGGGAKTTMRRALCSRCRGSYEVTQVAWDLAMFFTKILTERGERGLDGVGYCDPCGKEWEAEQDLEAERERAVAVEIYRRMRRGIAKVKSGTATRGDVSRFLAALPPGFVANHSLAIASFQDKVDTEFSKRDTASNGGGGAFAPEAS